MVQILGLMREELVYLVHPLSLVIRKGLPHSRYMVNMLTEIQREYEVPPNLKS